MNESSITDDGRSSATRGLWRYVGVSAVVLLVLVIPAASTGSDWGPLVAWCLTFLPGAAIVSLADRFRDPKLAVPFVLGSTAFRMGVAGIGAALLLWAVPSTPRTVFLVWLGGMYLLALGVEIYLTMSISSLWAVAKAGLERPASVTNLREAGR